MANTESPALVLGPVLRRLDGDTATVWVQTGQPGVVEVRAGTGGGKSGTFTVFDRHYALVVVAGLPADTVTPYQVLLDGAPVWPPAGYRYPAPVLRTRPAHGHPGDAPVRVVFGSCRQRSTADNRHLPPDALAAYARRLHELPAEWPDALLLLGDQVYADGVPAGDYAGFARLYHESWSDPAVRWLLSCVPTAMIFDDHEVIDDWNTSAQWRVDALATPDWRDRITAAMASYWVYQHLGNLHPDQLDTKHPDADPVYAALRAADPATGTEVLRDFGWRADTDRHGYRWSHARDVGRTRIVLVDNRAARVLTPGARAMLPPAEWAWLDAATSASGPAGDFDHLVLGLSVPWLLGPAVHYGEATVERLADRPDTRLGRLAERLRRRFDLEHWPAFGRSFAELATLTARIASRPGVASVSVLSGDVHHSYLAHVLPGGAGQAAPIWQLTCSPVYNQAPRYQRPLFRAAWFPPGGLAARLVARLVGVRRAPIRWRRESPVYFGNAIATLLLHGHGAHARIEGTRPDGTLTTVAEADLA